MHICFASLDYPSKSGGGGVGNYVRTVGKELVRRGHQVSVVALKREEGPDHFSDEGINVYGTHSGNLHWYVFKLPVLGKILSLPVREIEYSRNILKAVRRIETVERIDILEGTETGALWLGRVRSDIRTVVRLHGERYTFEKYTPPGKVPLDVCLSRFLQRRALRRVQRLTAPSQHHAEEVHRELGGNLPPPTVISNPISEKNGLLSTRSRKICSPLFLFVGRLQRVKGVVPLVQAIPLVRERLPDARFVFAGSYHPSIPPGEIESLLEEPGAVSAVSIRGHLSRQELDRLYHEATAVVIPSFYESFGYVCLEALSYGLPVVATNTGFFSEFVEEGTNGYLSPPGDFQSLAAACVNAANLPPLPCFQDLGKRYGLELVTDRLVEFYEDLLCNH